MNGNLYHRMDIAALNGEQTTMGRTDLLMWQTPSSITGCTCLDKQLSSIFSTGSRDAANVSNFMGLTEVTEMVDSDGIRMGQNFWKCY